MKPVVEERKEQRHDMDWPVSVWVPLLERFFNGRLINISQGGALISIPFEGYSFLKESIEVNLPRTNGLAKEKGQYSRIKLGKIIRIDTVETESTPIKRGAINVAIQFKDIIDD